MEAKESNRRVTIGLGLYAISLLMAIIVAGYGFRIVEPPLFRFEGWPAGTLWLIIAAHALPLLGMAIGAGLGMDGVRARIPMVLLVFVFGVAFSGSLSEGIADLYHAPYRVPARVLADYDCTLQSDPDAPGLRCVELEWEAPNGKWSRNRFVVGAETLPELVKGECLEAEIWPYHYALISASRASTSGCRRWP